MIGRATASLQSPARRLLQRAWGLSDIDTRLKWHAVWPVLHRLPRTTMRLLDAGCGDGSWTIEIARRRPAWRLVGIDRDIAGIEQAHRTAEGLSIDNARFLAADFLHYQPDEPFDIVLSVASAHYFADDRPAADAPVNGNGASSSGADGRDGGDAARLFERFAEWLAPGGLLLLYGPRRRGEVPALDALPAPFAMREVFAPEDLATLCGGAGLQVEMLSAVVCRMGTVAKQIGRLAGSSIPARALAYPVQVALAQLDGMTSPADAGVRSSALLLVARRPAR